jgi:hypothetical protein
MNDLDKDLKLWETGYQPGHYRTLSHCWVGRKVLETTSETLANHLDNIPFDSLDALFRDAVRVCRFLGFRYLWVDSLCIRQKNQADWEEEATKMDNIYENAFFTIAVHHNTEHGFIPQPSVFEVQPETQNEAAIYARRISAPGFLNLNGIYYDEPSSVFSTSYVD